tara:strand:+ start:558 stop:668 length:111 start_codon:yes stop_codon:yes gene_type:complete
MVKILAYINFAVFLLGAAGLGGLTSTDQKWIYLSDV